MRLRIRLPIVLALLIAACGHPAPDPTATGAGTLTSLRAPWLVEAGPELPVPVANNAVAAATSDGRSRLFSFLGLGSGRDYRAITTRAFALDLATARWDALPDVPGPAGRLAATAQAVGSRVYLFGGYSVAADGTETTSAATDIYLVGERRYARGADAPVALDDTVSGVWRNRLIYLVSGWSTDRTVTTVQAYDPAADRWLTATPIPGTPVFGHAGGLIDDTIVYCGGAKMLAPATPKYGISKDCYRGDINPADPTIVTWRAIASPPGPPRYRAAAGPVHTATLTGIMFVGGTANPYNYNGLGYDGRPSEPESSSWIYDTVRDAWVAGPVLDTPTMDHRGLVNAGDAWWVVGGMTGGQVIRTGTTRVAVGGGEK